jgi:hypothetical protein
VKRALLLLALLAAGCTDESASREALRKQGFRDIQLTGWAPLSCSDEDTFSTGFRATNPQGESVGGVVCCGWLKSCTVRF